MVPFAACPAIRKDIVLLLNSYVQLKLAEKIAGRKVALRGISMQNTNTISWEPFNLHLQSTFWRVNYPSPLWMVFHLRPIVIRPLLGMIMTSKSLGYFFLPRGGQILHLEPQVEVFL